MCVCVCVCVCADGIYWKFSTAIFTCIFFLLSLLAFFFAFNFCRVIN